MIELLYIQFIAFLLHFVGDYWLQSPWVAQTKTKSNWPALCHVSLYGVPFAVLLALSPMNFWGAVGAVYTIVITHFFIDRYRLARYVCYAKNFLAPQRTQVPSETECPSYQHWWWSWKECEKTGYPPTTPNHLADWLLIVTDNTMHLCINAAAIHFYWVTVGLR